MKTNILKTESDYTREVQDARNRNRGQRWTLTEYRYIEANAGKLTWQQIANDLGRTRSGVAQQAGKLGIRVLEPEYTEEEDEIIRSVYPDQGAEGTLYALLEKGFERSISSITTRRHVLGVTFVDTSKFEYLIELSQPELFSHLQALYKGATGGKLTYKKLASMCYVSYSRMQKWFAPGTGQEPLSKQMKHHFVLACRHAKRDK